MAKKDTKDTKETQPKAAEPLTEKELLAKVEKLETENEKLTGDLGDAMERLDAVESAKEVGVTATTIKTEKHGVVTFHGEGINYGGTVYTAADLKKQPEIVEALVDMDSGRVKKGK